MICSIDGVCVEEAKISVLDLGLLRGYGVFDFLRTYQGRPFHLEEHLQRLAYSAQQVHLFLPYSMQKIYLWIEELLKKGNYPESVIKIILTAGESSDQFFPTGNSHLIILVYPLEIRPSNGISTITCEGPRMLAKAKTLHYLPGIYALAQNKTASEALYLNRNKEILEGTTTNFFGWIGDTLYTAASDELLFGITREVVLNIAQDAFPIRLSPIHYNDLSLIEEAFITSTTKEILPVISIDDHPIPLGPKTQKLIELFRAYTKQNSWPKLSIERYKVDCQISSSVQ